MASLVVHDPGPLATIQDLGRVGWQRFGVVVAGALDMFSMRAANALVGNPPGAAAIEFTILGGRYEVDAPAARLAVTGGDFALAIDGRPIPAWRSFILRAGEVLTIGKATDALRGYLAVAGGIDVPPVLGSRSTHVRSGIGGWQGRALQAADRLPLVEQGLAGGADLELPPVARPARAGPVRIVPGPQDRYFGPDAIECLTGSAYLVTTDADRMGYRLSGPGIAHLGDDNIVSDGIALGSVQVPGSGQPIVMLADRQPTGGYPKIATVITPDIGTIAQAGPGDSIRFAVVDLARAHAVRREWDRTLAALPAALRPAGASNPYDSGRLLALNLVGGVVSVDED